MRVYSFSPEWSEESLFPVPACDSDVGDDTTKVRTGCWGDCVLSAVLGVAGCRVLGGWVQGACCWVQGARHLGDSVLGSDLPDIPGAACCKRRSPKEGRGSTIADEAEQHHARLIANLASGTEMSSKSRVEDMTRISDGLQSPAVARLAPRSTWDLADLGLQPIKAVARHRRWICSLAFAGLFLACFCYKPPSFCSTPHPCLTSPSSPGLHHLSLLGLFVAKNSLRSTCYSAVTASVLLPLTPSPHHHQLSFLLRPLSHPNSIHSHLSPLASRLRLHHRHSLHLAAYLPSSYSCEWLTSDKRRRSPHLKKIIYLVPHIPALHNSNNNSGTHYYYYYYYYFFFYF